VPAEQLDPISKLAQAHDSEEVLERAEELGASPRIRPEASVRCVLMLLA
jgi:hypothetical protein